LLWSTCWVKATDRVSSRVADSLYAAGNYSLSGLEYERVYFMDTTLRGRAIALLKKSFCLEQEQDLKGAYFNLERVVHQGLGDSLDHKIRHEKTLCAYLAADYGNAEYELQQMDFFIKDTAYTNQSLFLRVLVYSELEKWNETKTALEKYFSCQHIRTDTMDFDKWMPPHGLRSERNARLLSLIPGLGQVYAGKPGRALGSILLQGGAAAFCVISIMNGFYFEGIFTGGSMFFRFYSGGARYAGLLVRERNRKKNDAVKEKVKQLITRYAFQK
jgi:hypothetical protein